MLNILFSFTERVRERERVALIHIHIHTELYTSIRSKKRLNKYFHWHQSNKIICYADLRIHFYRNIAEIFLIGKTIDFLLVWMKNDRISLYNIFFCYWPWIQNFQTNAAASLNSFSHEERRLLLHRSCLCLVFVILQSF